VRHEAGFRLNLVDIMLLTVVGLLSWFGREALSDPFAEHHQYLIPVYVGLSFFLCCNVFRIGNRLEAIWYIPFVGLSLYGLTRPDIYWLLVLGVCEPLRAMLVAYRISKGNYAGAFYSRFRSGKIPL